MSEILNVGWVNEWVETVAQDKELSHIGKFSNFAVELVCEGKELKLFFNKGKLELAGEHRSQHDLIAFHGDHPAFVKWFGVNPEPLLNDFLALEKNQPGFSIPSERICLLRNLRVLQRLFAIAPRRG
ncbi:hypothetical protein [Pseudomonas helleri]|uniref:hypothetical protein n=1 Tax=Pseudomonas helleri TaxID=1608996 RepID=UPI00065354B6|nr:hypothetical protein [Pseudomonas helleri]KMN11021.1 hypothetical protein TU84_04710 [Pseudomonas helleri]